MNVICCLSHSSPLNPENLKSRITKFSVLKTILKRCSNRIAYYHLYCSITDVILISRRYFIVGFFDGVLTVQGMILGAYLSGMSIIDLIISAGIATALALGVSSGWGAYEAEMVEQKSLKNEKEKALLRKVDGGLMEKAHRFAIWLSAAVHAVSPIAAALIILLPFYFLAMSTAVIVSLITGFLMLFMVGVYMGKISRSRGDHASCGHHLEPQSRYLTVIL